ncbi:MAG: hypothetical protein MI922_05110 [Bacteroidales bacterium]|nr:hypothetical protein [Bacteroidales bacterium]
MILNEYELKLTVDEGKLIFMALTELPFKLVFELIGKLNRQSNNQKNSDDTITLLLKRSDLEIIFEALSKQPYDKVHELMSKIFTKEVIK